MVYCFKCANSELKKQTNKETAAYKVSKILDYEHIIMQRVQRKYTFETLNFKLLLIPDDTVDF